MPDAPPLAAHAESARSPASRAHPAPSRRRWTWNDINLVLDILLLVTFAVECFAAVIVRFVFPPGPGAAGWMLWTLDYDAWAGIQFWGLVVLTAGILLHVMLHWS